jgi:hypothetical protein
MGGPQSWGSAMLQRVAFLLLMAVILLAAILLGLSRPVHAAMRAIGPNVGLRIFV